MLNLREYFNLSQEVKGRIPHDIKTNNGWEYKVRNIPGQGLDKDICLLLTKLGAPKINVNF